MRRGSKPIRALIVGGGIGGLAAALGAKAGPSTICIRRGALQHLLLEAALAAAATVETARECIGFTADGSGCIARFAGGSMERGAVLIGADGSFGDPLGAVR